jgi:hypothetical protein
MRARTIVATMAILMSGAAGARAEPYEHSYDRIRAALERRTAASGSAIADATARRRTAPHPDLLFQQLSRADSRGRPVQTTPRDSIWNGLLIGAGIGGGGGYLWARNICGPNDRECFAITAPVGVLAGAGIGAAVGAVLDALNR